MVNLTLNSNFIIDYNIHNEIRKKLCIILKIFITKISLRYKIINTKYFIFILKCNNVLTLQSFHWHCISPWNEFYQSRSIFVSFANFLIPYCFQKIVNRNICWHTNTQFVCSNCHLNKTRSIVPAKMWLAYSPRDWLSKR